MEKSVMSCGKNYVDSEGIIRYDGKRVEGIELKGEVPPAGGKVATNLTYPVLTDEDGKVEGVDMTVAENRTRLHNEGSGITESDEKELKGRMANQPQHKAFVHDRRMKEGGGKRWKYEAKVDVPLDPTVVHDTPKFLPGTVLKTRS